MQALGGRKNKKRRKLKINVGKKSTNERKEGQVKEGQITTKREVRIYIGNERNIKGVHIIERLIRGKENRSDHMQKERSKR